MTPDQQHASPPSSALFRIREGSIAATFIVVALLLMIGITRTDVIAYAQQLDLFYLTAAIIAISIPGPILSFLDLPGQLLLWNAAGWCLGLAIFGMSSIGATPLFPLVLLGLALTYWPRTEDAATPWLGVSIAFVGGFLLCWAMWGNVYADIPFST